MTKEIIIDGVDVSKCVSFDKNNGLHICCCDDIRDEKTPFMLFCSNNPNCNFKQLKRAEQKLEKVKANCNETLSECSCKNPIIDIDCRECTSGGRVEKAKEILQIIEGEENV